MTWDNFGRRRSACIGVLEGVFKVRQLVYKTLIGEPY